MAWRGLFYLVAGAGIPAVRHVHADGSGRHVPLCHAVAGLSLPPASRLLLMCHACAPLSSHLLPSPSRSFPLLLSPTPSARPDKGAMPMGRAGTMGIDQGHGHPRKAPKQARRPCRRNGVSSVSLHLLFPVSVSTLVSWPARARQLQVLGPDERSHGPCYARNCCCPLHLILLGLILM